MTIRYVAVCDGCGKEVGHTEMNAWGWVHIQEPNKLLGCRKEFNLCSLDCLGIWWRHQSTHEALGFGGDR